MGVVLCLEVRSIAIERRQPLVNLMLTLMISKLDRPSWRLTRKRVLPYQEIGNLRGNPLSGFTNDGAQTRVSEYWPVVLCS